MLYKQCYMKSDHNVQLKQFENIKIFRRVMFCTYNCNTACISIKYVCPIKFTIYNLHLTHYLCNYEF